eukprot:447542-Rhodomonas_salina.1
MLSRRNVQSICRSQWVKIRERLSRWYQVRLPLSAHSAAIYGGAAAIYGVDARIHGGNAAMYGANVLFPLLFVAEMRCFHGGAAAIFGSNSDIGGGCAVVYGGRATCCSLRSQCSSCATS